LYSIILEDLYYLPVDNEGNILNVSNYNLMPKIIRDSVNSILHFVLDQSHNNIHSIYIRGSSVNGRFREHNSDIDLMIVYQDSYNIPKGLRLALNDKFVSKGGYFSHIDLAERNLNEALTMPFNFTIKTQTLCIYGKNLQKSIPNFKIDNTILYYPYFIAENLNWVVNNLRKENDKQRIKKSGKKLFKSVLRAGFEAIMLNVGKYSRDLYTCYFELQKHYPEKKESLFRILYYSIFATDGKEEILQLTNDVHEWLITISKKSLEK